MMSRLPQGRGRVAALSMLLGGLAALGQAPWGLWWVSLPALAGLFALLAQAAHWKRAAWVGWCGGLGYFAVALFWIVEPFLVDIGRHGWMAPFALCLTAGGFALFWGLAFGVAHRLGGSSAQVAVGVAALSLSELIRGVILTGFPWAMIGHIWIDTPVLQLAPFGGATLLTFLALLAASLPVIMKRTAVGAGVAVVAVGLTWGYGLYALDQTELPNPEERLTARLIQPNAAQHLKWDPDHIGTIFLRQLAMTAEPADTELDVIIWPETSLASRLDVADAALEAMAEAADGVPLVFGANDLVGDTYRNSLAVMNRDGQLADKYYKHHLVPFGEYIPLGDLLSKFGISGMAARDGAGYSPGPGPRLVEIDGVGSALPLICYELIFPRHLRTVERPDFILQITNDAWFGSVSGPYQHLAQARLRAVEQGLGLVRSANTGITAAIDPLGRILRQIPLNEAGYMDIPVPAALPQTPYSRYGDWLMGSVLLVLLISLIIARRRNVD